MQPDSPFYQPQKPAAPGPEPDPPRPSLYPPPAPGTPLQPIQSPPQPSNQPPPPPPPIQPMVTTSPMGEKLPRGESIKSVLYTILILLLAPLLALCITAFVFQSYEVDGPSMEPTLATHDRLIIVKIPRTWARITGKDYFPKRGEVVVFVKKGLFDFSADKEKQLIKRVVALPGERVTVHDGKVTVYNQQNPEGFDPDKLLPHGDKIGTTSGEIDTTVRAGEVYVMGDNRANSLDSRVFGSIPAQDIIGKLSLRLLPLDNAEAF